MKPIILLLLLTIALPTTNLLTADSARQRSSFDFDWKFLLSDPADAQKPDFNDTSWTPIDLPHDWSINGPFDRAAPAAGNGGYLPTGIGWYRKTFKIPDTYKNKTIAIEFDGIYENSEVWINGQSLGKRPYGYTSFIYDLTKYLNFNNQDNTIAVRVDNSLQPNSRWYSGSGIYRHTWLLVTDNLHIPQWGTAVTTPDVSPTSATIEISTTLINSRQTPAEFDLLFNVLDQDGDTIAPAGRQTHGQLDPGAQKQFTQRLELNEPKLWSIDTPNLYTVRCEVRADNQLVDQYDTPIGIRTAVFDVNKGFLLNGQPIKLNGVCLHADGGGVGSAVPEGVWARRFQLLKEMGCNAIRTSHNPPTPEFLDLCDKMGLLVMDEPFDCWVESKRRNDYHIFFKQWWQQDLIDFIHRDRNHPSVVLWSAGNEIPDQTTPDGPAILKKIVDTFHTEDPTRPVTSACDKIAAEPKATPDDFLALLDVVGYNYVDRWRDRADKYYSIDRQAFPQRKFIGTESVSMSSVRGDYTYLFPTPPTQPATQPTTRPRLPRAPITNMHLNVEQLWKFVSTYDYVSGDFMWTGIDYIGEANWPNKIASFGPLDTAGFKKDGFYFYQSQWTTTPVLHLFPHWNWKGREGQIIPVTAYTNCDTVELFLNGKSFGTKGYEFPRHGMEQNYGIQPPRALAPRTTSDLHLSWDVPYEPGTLKAVGTINGHPLTEEITTTGDPATIDLSADKPQLIADHQDVAHFTIKILDANGHIVPTASNEVTFDLTGPAKIIAVDNGNPASDESFKTNHRKAFNGLCLAILQSTTDPGPIHLTAKSPGLRDATIELNSQSPPP